MSEIIMKFNTKKWYEKSYRRNLVDMHIEDWNEEFLAKLDVSLYIDMLKKAKVEATMIYANSHIGYCYWDTPYGKQHSQPKAKTFLADMLKACDDNNIHKIVYFSLVYDNWCYDNNKEWRMVDINGKSYKDLSERYGICCINSESYKQYIKNQLGDLIDKFTFDGFFLDMTFWPMICACDSCKAKYKMETGKAIPYVIDWNDGEWLLFQRKREEWLNMFAEEISSFIKNKNPNLSIEHQSALALFGWWRGVTEGNALNSDYCGGDLYGGFNEQSFACKLYRNLSVNQPFEYMTSRADPNLTYHTCTKSEQSLAQHAFITFAHHGAFLFIDAIDPTGQMHPKTYEIMGRVFDKSKRFEKYFIGELCADVAVYMSLTSKINLKLNGADIPPKEVLEYSHLDAAGGAATKLKNHNVLHDIISRRNLDNLKKYKILIVPDVYLMDDDEVDQIEKYVKGGGSLYVSGGIKNKLMQKLIGITLKGQTKESLTFMKPCYNSHGLLKEIEAGAPVTIADKQWVAAVSSDSEILATVTLPFTDPDDLTKVSSIHSNPPGIETSSPSILYKRVGEGQIMWSAAPIEASPAYDNKKIFVELIEFLIGNKSFYSSAPDPIEFIVFEDNNIHIVHITNQQEMEPLVQVHDIEFSIKIKFPVVSVRLAPDCSDLKYTVTGDFLTVYLPRLEIFETIIIEYSEE